MPSCNGNCAAVQLLLTVCLVVPIYIIAAVESAGWTDEEATGFAIFGSVLGLSPKICLSRPHVLQLPHGPRSAFPRFLEMPRPI